MTGFNTDSFIEVVTLSDENGTDIICAFKENATDEEKIQGLLDEDFNINDAIELVTFRECKASNNNAWWSIEKIRFR